MIEDFKCIAVAHVPPYVYATLEVAIHDAASQRVKRFTGAADDDKIEIRVARCDQAERIDQYVVPFLVLERTDVDDVAAAGR